MHYRWKYTGLKCGCVLWGRIVSCMRFWIWCSVFIRAPQKLNSRLAVNSVLKQMSSRLKQQRFTFWTGPRGHLWNSPGPPPTSSSPWFSSQWQSVLVFLGAFAKLRKATISFVVSVRSHGTTCLPLDGFSWKFIFEHFSKICRENSIFIKIWEE
jgi:hypothetical protein